MEVTEIISSISSIMQFYVPGYVGIRVYQFCVDAKTRTGTAHTVACVASSYVLSELMNCLKAVWPKTPLFTKLYCRIPISTALFVITCIAFATIARSNWFTDLTTYLFGRSVKRDALTMTLDDKGDTGIFIWLKDAKEEECIYGGYGGRDTDSNGEQWIIVSEPEIRKSLQDKDPYVFGSESKWLFRMSDIKSILVQNPNWKEE